jgi:hypothetical protein
MRYSNWRIKVKRGCKYSHKLSKNSTEISMQYLVFWPSFLHMIVLFLSLKHCCTDSSLAIQNFHLVLLAMNSFWLYAIEILWHVKSVRFSFQIEGYEVWVINNTFFCLNANNIWTNLVVFHLKSCQFLRHPLTFKG